MGPAEGRRETALESIADVATQLRKHVIEMIGVGKPGHLGGAFSLAEIVAYLYFHRMAFNPEAPKQPGRDRFLLSKGHGVLIQYAALTELGLISRAELPGTKSLGSVLQGHPDMKTPGIEAVTGSLGQGLSIGLGMALGLRIDGRDSAVYVVIGDGELSEGQLWEAAMAAARYKASNLIAIVDRNRFQATGPTEEVFAIPNLVEKWKAFGWDVLEMDGHDLSAVHQTFVKADGLSREKPVAIIAHTVKGKGVSFAENNAAFHNGALTQEQYDAALEELNRFERQVV